MDSAVIYRYYRLDLYIFFFSPFERVSPALVVEMWERSW